MNFKDMPVMNSPRGYLLVLLLMIGVASAMLLYFRKKRWI
jgi:magnesium transporter